MSTKYIQTIITNNASRQFDLNLFENISWFNTSFRSHKEIIASLIDIYEEI